MSVRTEINGRVLTVYLEGEIDHHSARHMREIIDASILSSAPQMLVLDFKDVPFMDSSGIALIMKIHRRMSLCGGRVWVENAAKQPLRVIDTSGIDRIIKISSVREA